MLKGSDINGINKHHYTFILYKSNFRGKKKKKKAGFQGRMKSFGDVF
jgi:hypothetical protein